ncbi:MULTISPECIES: cytochrome b/b6 domain-containing protein [unclassified Caballeronia]|uniref:cytochrome b/b6 domain-containing protein n=1 Tax=unclassified Caballeronia TaxID=2646786 RepID=UPI00285E2B4E|nr:MULTISPECIES: cytochrome b/b6 domain-containing protein [unclassified Caballeronia]MDR5752089.1 cytochrome b/b6 domain-containing protein [Caballeronia sp. LZ024]MDR5843770.1 cytochrome b/b6 domain-containing protein [Caballeronia sp. LZ031]
MPATIVHRIKIWDLCVRLTHWTVAGIVIWNLFGPTDEAHRVLGYIAGGLVVLRILWGLVGTPHARFSAWWPTPSHLADYLRSLAAGKPIHHLSHNPLGGLMAIALWLLILALGVTGWLMRLDAFWGEDWPQDLHEYLSIALELCVYAHVVAALVMSVWMRENLIVAMLTGFKRDPHSKKAP